MKRTLVALAALLLSSAALAQTQFPASTLWGNATTSTGLPTTVTVPACPTGALNYAPGLGFGCGVLSSGVPGGGDTQIQYNNAGTFGGLTDVQMTARVQPFTSALSGAAPASGGGTTAFLRADGTWAVPPSALGAVNSVANSDSTLTIAPTTGSVVASLNLAHSNTWTASQNTTINQNAQSLNLITNTDPGTNASATLGASNGTGSVFFGMSGANYTAAGPLVTNRGFVFSSGVDIVLSTATANAVIIGTSLTERARFTAAGLSIQLGGQGSAPDAPLTVNGGTGASIAAPGFGPIVHLVGGDSGNASINFDTFGGASLWVSRIASGTRTVPLASVGGSMQIALLAWDGASYNTVANVNMTILNPQSPSDHSGRIKLQTTAPGAGILTTATVTSVGLGIQPLGQEVLADAPLTVNANTVANAPGAFIANLHILGADGQANRLVMDSFGSSNSIVARVSGGTAAAKTAVTAGTLLLQIAAPPFDGASYTSSSQIQIVAAENTTATGAGSYLKVATVPIGTVAGAVEMARFQPSGGLSVGSANIAIDPGSGRIAASGAQFATNGASNTFITYDNANTGGFTGFKVTSGGANFIVGVGGTTYTTIPAFTNYAGLYTDGGIGITLDTYAAAPITFLIGNNEVARFQANGLTIKGPSAGITAMGVSAIASGACSLTQATSTGASNTDVVAASFWNDPTGLTGYIPSVNGMLSIVSWVSPGIVNFKVCNNTAASITPGAIAIQWRLIH